MDRDLYAFMGGVAASGARYKVEVVRLAGGTYQANAYSAGGSTAWTKPTLLLESADLGAVVRKASTKFAEKTVPGRDRVYTRPMVGGPDAYPFPKGVSTLPDHPLCWMTGRPLDLLPSELRYRAILAPGQSPDAVGAAPPPAVNFAGTPPLGQVVMLCETIPTANLLDLMVEDDGWLMTEKMEGDRQQLHHDAAGAVYMTNRSGEVVNCPEPVAREMKAKTPRGTSLDGELITVDQGGHAQLYVGARADIQLFVTFELLHHPAFPFGAMQQPQLPRLQQLGRLFPMFKPPIYASDGAIRCVGWAEGSAAKRQLLAEIRARTGEGVVMRDVMAGYEGKRSTSWMRWRDRLAEIDAVVIDYKEGTGKYAGTVGGVQVGLYDGIHLRSIGWAGSGWSDAERADLLRRWQAGQNNYVVTIQTFGLNFGDQVIRPSGIRIRAAGNKRPAECTFESEVGRGAGLYRAK